MFGLVTRLAQTRSEVKHCKHKSGGNADTLWRPVNQNCIRRPEPGIYFLATTTDSTTLTLRSTSIPSQTITILNAQTKKKFAKAPITGAPEAFQLAGDR